MRVWQPSWIATATVTHNATGTSWTLTFSEWDHVIASFVDLRRAVLELESELAS